MAIPCGACGKPVHPSVVICAHCGGETGVAPDRRMSGAEALAVIEVEAIRNTPPVPHDPYLRTWDAPVGGLDVVVAVVESAVNAVGAWTERRGEPQIPRAIARINPRPASPPDEESPEVPPPSDATPRLLK
ncbi:MAG: hypothetical protein SFX73_38445 [Kofleriaceae bacterium]|nr:hypothetical protein [Kofleriaceae bacterium]